VFVSVYTCVKNGLHLDFHIVEMLKHHLPLADEIVVNEGYSTDGTYETLLNIDPKIKIFRMHWNREEGEHWWLHFKDASRRRCTGDWCILLDADEFIPEWQFDDLRDFLERTSDDLVPVRFLNFYGNYRVYHRDPAKSHWVTNKMMIHMNLPDDIEIWGDGANVRLKGKEFSFGDTPPRWVVHHFGAVRRPGRLRQSWWLQGRFRTDRSVRFRPPQWVFDLFPLNWADTTFMEHLAIYDGPLVKAVRDNPKRFAPDHYKLLGLLAERDAATSGPLRYRTT